MKGLKRIETNGDQIRVEGNYEKENGLEEAGVRTLYVNNYNQIYAAYLNVVIRIDGREKDKIESVYTLQSGLTDGHVSCMVDDHIGGLTGFLFLLLVVSYIIIHRDIRRIKRYKAKTVNLKATP